MRELIRILFLCFYFCLNECTNKCIKIRGLGYVEKVNQMVGEQI